MSYVIHLIKRFEASKQVASSALTAEKAKVLTLKAEAKQLFSDTYEEYDKMHSTVNSSWSTDSRTHPELHVSAAETAFLSKDVVTAKTIISRFLLMNPQEDQFFCRAKLTLAEILNYEATPTNGVASTAARKEAMKEVMTVLAVATKPTNALRYKFLVYNASVIGWRIMQSFLREGRAKYFADEILKLSAALETNNDDDRNWRIMYLSAAALTLEDSAKGKEAADLLDIAINHALVLLEKDAKLKEVHEADIADASTKTEGLMSSIRDLDDRVAARTRPPKIDPYAEDDDIAGLPDLGFGETTEESAAAAAEAAKSQREKEEGNRIAEESEKAEYAKLKAALNIAKAAKSRSEERLRVLLSDSQAPQEERTLRLCMQRVHVLPADFKKIAELPFVKQSARSRCLVNLQAMVSNGITDKDWPATFEAMLKDPDLAKLGNLEVETLLDMCRSAWRLNLREYAIQSAEMAATATVSSPVCTVKSDLCAAIKIVADLDSTSANTALAQRVSEKEAEGYLADRRIEAVKLLERVLTVCKARVDDHALLQEVCMTLWNTCVP